MKGVLLLAAIAGLAGCVPNPRAAAPAAPGESRRSVLPEPLRVRYTPEELASACAQAEDAANAGIARLVASTAATPSFEATFGAWDATVADYRDATDRLSFLKDVHPDEKVRAAAATCEERAGAFLAGLYAHDDVYRALLRARATATNGDQARVVELVLRDLRRAGAGLSASDRAELVKIRARIAELQTQYLARLCGDRTTVEATPAELAGVPAPAMARYAKTADGTKLVVTMRAPDVNPVLESATNRETRHRAQVAILGRNAENLALLAEAVRLRDRAAKLLGYASHDDYVTAVRMAGDSKTVASFLEGVRRDAAPALETERARLRRILVDETGDPAAVVSSWDWRHLEKRATEERTGVSDDDVRRYFPAEKVIAGMLEAYSRLFSIRIVKIEAEGWAGGVSLYEIRELDGRPVGRFYLDLYSRPGKFNHEESVSLVTARERDGAWQLPLGALVVNLAPPAAGSPAYLAPAEAGAIFHEFGHVLHGAFTRTRWAALGRSALPKDFTETPALLFEAFPLEPEVLPLISADPADPSKPMPAVLAATLRATEKDGAGVRYARSVFLAELDQAIHARGDADPDAEAKRLWTEIVGFPQDPREHVAANFGHLMGGYDASYYGYLWSEVFADDLLATFRRAGVLDPAIGRRFRDDVLSRGYGEDPKASLSRFLGRSPDDRAFLVESGLSAR